MSDSRGDSSSYYISENLIIMEYIGIFFQLIIINKAMSSQCGNVDVLQPTIFKGTPTLRGQWPFIAALLEAETNEFFCGATLISMKLVMTAAHCVQRKFHETLLATDVIVLLGAYDLSAENETDVLRSEVHEIYVHTDWKDSTLSYDADIAILLLKEIVIFSNHIRPVCMPTNDVSIDGIKGSIVGWGLTENGTNVHLQYPRHAQTNALNAVYCLTTDPQLAYLLSTRSFCGSGGDGGPNKGDSGGGFFVLTGSVCVQYGIISALRINASGIVDVNSFAVYTSVKLFETWINETVSRTGGIVMTAIEKINLNCRYDYDYMWGYTCFLHNLEIRTEKVDIAFTGEHENGKTNMDVQRIEFFNGTMLYLPNVEHFFKNLVSIGVNPKLNLKSLRRENFKNLDHLTVLDVYGNNIETLDEETLWDLPNLKELNAHTNKLKVLHERTFEKDTKLISVSLSVNFIETLNEFTLSALSNLEGFYFHTNKLKVLHERIFENNPKLVYIEINKNEIETLHEKTLWSLPNLEEFNAHTNKIQILHERTFAKSPKLRIVSFSINEIEVLNKNTLRGLPNLEGFYFHTNKLKVLHERTFDSNPKLVYIEINKNEIEALDEKTLWSLPNLEEFYIHTNKLQILHERTFEKNSYSREVYLGNNQFEFLPRDLFKNNVVLTVVDLGVNRLKIIDTDFTTFKKLRHLNLFGNICINNQYFKSNARQLFRHLTDFQSVISANCSSTNIQVN